MFNKRFFVVLLVLSLAMVLALPAVNAESDGRVVVRVFLDTENDMHDRGNGGLRGWQVTLNGETKTTGRNGFASFDSANVGDVVRIATPRGGLPVDSGWRLARDNAPAVQPSGNRVFASAPAYTLTESDFITRVNGNTEAWVRFSAIRVNRITTGGANEGDVITFARTSPYRLMDEIEANRGGWASVVAGGYFYGETYTVTNVTQNKSFEVTIPFGYQPKINWAEGTCKDCGS